MKVISSGTSFLLLYVLCILRKSVSSRRSVLYVSCVIIEYDKLRYRERQRERDIEKKIQIHLDLIVKRLKLDYNKIQLSTDSRKNANV